jgi:vacuolar protein sorting-associated protein 41
MSQEDSEITDSNEGETEEESSDEESQEEPRLKYQRLGADVIDILKNDVASCMAVSEKLLVKQILFFIFFLN